MKIHIKGDIIANDDKLIYDLLDLEGTCPKDVLPLLEQANGGEVDIYINSGGGDIFAASEIYDALRAYTGAIRIHVVGLAASAASVIACAGPSDIVPTGMFMVHNVSGATRGDYHDMDDAGELLRKADKTIAAAYVEKTGMSEKDALAMMDQETWLTAAEAVDRGFIDSLSKPQRLVAAGPVTLPPQVLDKLKSLLVKGPETIPEGGDPAGKNKQRAEAELRLLKLRGEILK